MSLQNCTDVRSKNTIDKQMFFSCLHPDADNLAALYTIVQPMLDTGISWGSLRLTVLVVFLLIKCILQIDVLPMLSHTRVPLRLSLMHLLHWD